MFPRTYWGGHYFGGDYWPAVAAVVVVTPTLSQPSGSGGVLGRMPPLRTRSTAREEREAAQRIQRRRDEDELLVVLAMLEAEW